MPKDNGRSGETQQHVPKDADHADPSVHLTCERLKARAAESTPPDRERRGQPQSEQRQVGGLTADILFWRGGRR
jgi:hypothetical protein